MNEKQLTSFHYRVPMTCAGLTRCFMLLWLSLLIQSCRVTQNEVARLPSPDNGMDAVVVEQDYNATTSFLYELRIVSRDSPLQSGVPVASIYGAMRNERAYGINTKWENSSHVVVEFYKSQGVRRTVREINFGGRHVTIELKPGVFDPTAPPGGMAYNRNKR
jgi:hypothetical protein